jgi:hypothetical protein
MWPLVSSIRVAMRCARAGGGNGATKGRRCPYRANSRQESQKRLQILGQKFANGWNSGAVGVEKRGDCCIQSKGRPTAATGRCRGKDAEPSKLLGVAVILVTG